MKNTLLQLVCRILRFLGLACFKISDSFAGEEVVTYDDFFQNNDLNNNDYEEKNKEENEDNYEEENYDYNYEDEDDDDYDEEDYGYYDFFDEDFDFYKAGDYYYLSGEKIHEDFYHLKDISITNWKNFKGSNEILGNFNYLEYNASFNEFLEESKALFMNKLHKFLRERTHVSFYKKVLKCIVLGKSYEEVISFSEFSKVKIDAMVRNYTVERFFGEEIPFTAHVTFLIYLKYEERKLDALNFTMTSTIQEEFDRESILHDLNITNSHERKAFLESIGIKVEEDYCTEVPFHKEKDEEKK